MADVFVNFKSPAGRIKPMHGVNNGPVRTATGKGRDNFREFQAAGIPYVRTHDTSFYEVYGSEHVVDIQAIFPDFTKNPYDPANYDFTLTDDYLADIVAAGGSIFYRLGSKIEHWRKKYGTIVPADFRKWAVICEHIIRHYNEGWADGFHYNIVYWEIWNEPDGVAADGSQPNWSGTPEDFYELYAVAATYLKGRFPHLKIGGPAVSGYAEGGKWTKRFLEYLAAQTPRVPLDFFSWHAYMTYPCVVRMMNEETRGYLNAAGYTETESILDEYNYMEDFSQRFVESIEQITGMHGASFTAACMAVGQSTTLDLLLYYDASPCVFNGMFDFYSLRPLKGYYPFLLFSRLYAMKNAVECRSEDENITIVAAEKDGKCALMLTHYRPDNQPAQETVTLHLGGIADGEWQAEILDATRTLEPCHFRAEKGTLTLELPSDCVVYLTR